MIRGNDIPGLEINNDLRHFLNDPGLDEMRGLDCMLGLGYSITPDMI